MKSSTLPMLLLLSGAVGCAPEAMDVALEPAPPVLRRLSQSQYEHAIRDLFGADVYVPADLEPDLRLNGLAAIGSSQVALSPRGVSRYEEASYVIAEQVMDPSRRDDLLPCTPEAKVDDACARAFFEETGRRAWRRALTPDELDTLVAVAGEAAAVLDDGFHDGLEFGIAVLLQSPDFLMRPELGVVNPDEERTGRWYTGYEMAARLSFLFWDSIPDDELLDAAEAGELGTVEGLEAQTARLLADPRAEDGLAAWVTDLLELHELDGIQKDTTVFVQFTDGFTDSAKQETLSLFHHLVFETDADMRDVLTTRRTEIDRTLARVYGVKAPSRDGFAEVELPADGPRAGLLGHASMLTLHAHPTSTSATKRGKFVRETLLCEEVPAPPAGVNTAIPEPDPTRPTLRDRIQVHLTSPSCAGCHQIMDPIGLGLEAFDGTGVYRTTENGVPIDATGDLDEEAFDGALGLANAIREHEHFVPCQVDQVARYALGREVDSGEQEAMSWLVDRYIAEGHRLQPLWQALVTHPLFRRVGEVQ